MFNVPSITTPFPPTEKAQRKEDCNMFCAAVTSLLGNADCLGKVEGFRFFEIKLD